ncbi:DUF5677 domain-containing protein [Paraburkholderia tropica]|uniref:DUF5677 domain-containing protein n=1 Tax=Paraburkholderia tropica TaxID=92647 RepID=UPI002AB1FA60|nr:DUF5677 domain-containing protein [Paraburkholderia tropica]
MARADGRRAAASKVLDSFEAMIGRANVNDSGKARIGACLTLTIFEQFRSALCLIDNNLGTHAAGPIRSMLEGVTDLLNLSQRAEYLDQLHFENARNNVILFDELMKLDGVPADMAEKVGKWREVEQPIRNRLAKAGHTKIDVAQKMRNGGIGDAYAQYRILCAFVHTSITSLLSRHAGRERLTELGYCRQPDEPVIGMMLLIAVDLLVRAASELHHFSDLNEDEVNAVAESAKAMWAAVDPDYVQSSAEDAKEAKPAEPAQPAALAADR